MDFLKFFLFLFFQSSKEVSAMVVNVLFQTRQDERDNRKPHWT